MSITAIGLKNLTEKDIGVTLYDGGLRGRVRKNSKGIAVDFSYRYEFKKKQYELSLGSWPKYTLREINTFKTDAQTQILKGNNPHLEKQKAKQLLADRLEESKRQEAKLTVGVLFDEWKQRKLSQYKDGGHAVVGIFTKNVIPFIGHIPVQDVTKGEITQLLQRIEDRGTTRMPKMVLSLLKQFFDYAILKDEVTKSPVTSLKSSDFGGPDRSRDRVLNADELVDLFQKVPAAKLLHSTEYSLWIMISTLCRIGELSRAKWEDVDLKNKIWTIPETKNGRTHRVYLSNFACYWFEKIQALRLSGVWVIPNRNDTDHADPKNITKQVGDRQLDEVENIHKKRTKNYSSLALDGGRWTPHDLRRTGATIMGELGISPDVIEKCLNHTEQSKLIRTYQRQTKTQKQKDAWQALGKVLADLLQMEVVEPMKIAA